jgi:hypothetical protein
MLGEGVGQVRLARPEVNQELALTNAVLELIPTHVHGLGPLLFHGLVGETSGRGVVDLNGRGRVRMAELKERGADGYRLLGIEVARADFSLGGRPNDDVDDGAERVDGSIEGRDAGRRGSGVDRRGAEGKMPSGTAARTCLGEVRGIAVQVQAYVASVVADDGQWVRYRIVHHPLTRCERVLGGLFARRRWFPL